MQNATTLFCQHSDIHVQLNEIAKHFNGSKLIFSGGSITDDGAMQIFELLCARDCDKPLTISFNDVYVPMKGVSRICRTISLNLSPIDELFIDLESVGSLGLACFITALKVCGLGYFVL